VPYLLDTNVVSETRKRNCDPNVRAWIASVPGDELHISVLVLGEIRGGIERLRRRDPTQADVLERWLLSLARDFADRTLAVDAAIADEWGRLNVPDPLPAIDGLSVATARAHNLTLVTRNVRDVERTHVRMFNPFEPR